MFLDYWIFSTTNKESYIKLSSLNKKINFDNILFLTLTKTKSYF